MYKSKDGLLFDGGVISSVIAFYASLVIPTFLPNFHWRPAL